MDVARQIDAMVRALPVAVVAVDRRARVIAANDAARRLLGPDPLDRPFVTLLRNPGVNQAIDRVLAPGHLAASASDPGPGGNGGALTMRAAIGAGSSGREPYFDVTVAPLPATLGGGALVTLIDTAPVEGAEQIRRDFVANVSHELRTPLTALIGFIETLRGPARNDAAARDRFLDIMERETHRMNRLVSDLLSLSRVESGERLRPVARVDLAVLLGGVATTLGPAAEKAGVRIELDTGDAPAWIPGDQDQLTQVFQNIIENAIKYGGSGGWVGIALREITHEPMLRGPAYSIEIADRGEGIDAIHLPRLTERFYRVDTHRSREKGGTGLGLAIVKHIVARHRGRLRIHSERGQGSRFTIVLPQASAAQPPAG
ncbi:ATP-binding protein [Paracoccus sp. TK19116]|uniref:histidine kinase n=1 Tax=Paracoccus albicereus TaxID=2922394 RepID=A0ABT1MP25_9RHOB|nr:ATP-binding protein [Paracoccus albicereus]MCQ0970032.1 ATP-binding protein [Paracoccus albicereus]